MRARNGLRRLGQNLLLVSGSLVVGLMLAEGILDLLDRPRFYEPRSSPPQFFFPDELSRDPIGWVNVPSSRIRFLYDGNPRGYFGPDDEVDHHTNSAGFRGSTFELRHGPLDSSVVKADGTRRVVFLGDSFTFGEGVWSEDTYAEVSARLLTEHYAGSGVRFEAYNFGVGGHNTTQSLRVLETRGLASDPDMVVLGYVLNDAEPPLFQIDPVTGERRRRHQPIEALFGEGRRPGGAPAGLRSVRLVKQLFTDRHSSRVTVVFYESLFTDDNPGWRASRNALWKIMTTCHESGIPCCILLFPILHRLDDDYPFRWIHERIRQQVDRTPAIFIDLLPELEGRRTADLWVHPTDHHPNEIVHAQAARRVAEEAIARNVFEL